MTAREYLAQLKAEKEKLCILKNEFEVIDSLSKGAKSLSFDGMPHGTRLSDPSAQYAVRIIDLLEQIEEQETKCQSLESEMLGMICRMPCVTVNDVRQQDVLRLRYIHLLPWAIITRILFGGVEAYEERQESYLRRTTLIHGKALEKFEFILQREQFTGKKPDDSTPVTSDYFSQKREGVKNAKIENDR